MVLGKRSNYLFSLAELEEKPMDFLRNVLAPKGQITGIGDSCSRETL